MDTKSYKISLEKHPLISINVIPGHFTTSNAHCNNFLDVSRLKTNAIIARDVARELVIPYLSSTIVDTIVCMERTEVIGAYLAEELMKEGVAVINAGNEINVVSPSSNVNGNLVFQDNVTGCISNKNILLLISSISIGRTLDSSRECLAYYGGKIAGVSALFAASREKLGNDVHTLFTSEDIPGYKLYNTGECDMCKAGLKLDAIVSSEGYTILGRS